MKYPIEMIVWEDAYNEDQTSWQRIDTIKVEPALIVSVGFVVKEGKKGVILSMDYDEDEDNCHAWSFIPKSVIQSRVRLEGPVTDPQP